jgi:hypothetical protein
MTDEIKDPRVPGWRFRIEEFSPGGYRVDGLHFDGRSVSRQGSDPDAVLAECVEDARTLPLRRSR